MTGIRTVTSIQMLKVTAGMTICHQILTSGVTSAVNKVEVSEYARQ